MGFRFSVRFRFRSSQRDIAPRRPRQKYATGTLVSAVQGNFKAGPVEGLKNMVYLRHLTNCDVGSLPATAAAPSQVQNLQGIRDAAELCRLENPSSLLLQKQTQNIRCTCWFKSPSTQRVYVDSPLNYSQICELRNCLELSDAIQKW